MELHCVSPHALSDQRPLSAEEEGSGRASGRGPPLQAAPAPSAAPSPTGRTEVGPSAGTASGGRPAGSGAAWGEPAVEEEAEADSALVGTRCDAAAPPPEEEAEAERWLPGSRSEPMTQTRW